MQRRKPGVFLTPDQCPQAGRERMILPQPVALVGQRTGHPEATMLRHMRDSGAVFMMGQNPELPVMPERPTLLDFFHYRFSDIAFMHLLQCAKLALDAGQEEKIVMACLYVVCVANVFFVMGVLRLSVRPLPQFHA